MTAAELRVAASFLADGATIDAWPDDNLGGHALAYAAAGWEVLPLHSWDCRCPSTGKRAGCADNEGGRGKTPRPLHGVLDASTDLQQVVQWWSRWPSANIGGRLPRGVVAVDIDPRHEGGATWDALVDRHGPFTTRTAITGRGDNGRHLYVEHPGGELVGVLGAGVEVKTSRGYTVLPPSRHALGGLYRWEDATAPIMPAPRWLADLLRRPAPPRKLPTSTAGSYSGDSIAEWYEAVHTWADILGPHGWHLVHGAGDDDGSSWRHPNATAATSATVRHGCLFVYSTNTPFDETEAGDPHGYTRFRAYAILDHGGDLSAAARAARQLREVAA